MDSQAGTLHVVTVTSFVQCFFCPLQAMYSFIAKFEELQKNLAPLQEIAAQMYPYTIL